MSRIFRLLNRLLCYEVVTGPANQRFLQRWRLLALPGGRRVYLRHYQGSDWTRDMHDHQAWFISIGLWGSYVEERYDKQGQKIRKRYTAPWIRFFPATHIHRLRIRPSYSTWTLIASGREAREWGFYTDSGWIEWTTYLRLRGGNRGVD